MTGGRNAGGTGHGDPASGGPIPVGSWTVDPLSFHPDLCIACNICIDVCQVDIMLPNPVDGLPPLVAYPEECWYDGS